MPPGCLPAEVFREDPGHAWRTVSNLPWEGLGIPSNELGEVAREREFWTSPLLPTWPSNCQKMDGGTLGASLEVPLNKRALTSPQGRTLVVPVSKLSRNASGTRNYNVQYWCCDRETQRHRWRYTVSSLIWITCIRALHNYYNYW